MCVYVYMCVWRGVCTIAGARRGQRKVLGPLDLELQVIANLLTRVLGDRTKLFYETARNSWPLACLSSPELVS